jgi:hypothetical protein
MSQHLTSQRSVYNCRVIHWIHILPPKELLFHISTRLQTEVVKFSIRVYIYIDSMCCNAPLFCLFTRPCYISRLFNSILQYVNISGQVIFIISIIKQILTYESKYMYIHVLYLFNVNNLFIKKFWLKYCLGLMLQRSLQLS